MEIIRFLAEKSDEATETLFASIIGYIATALSIFFFVSPYKLFRDYLETKDTKNFPLLMFIANICNCAIWVVIGAGRRNTPQWVCNIIGLVINIFWMTWLCYILFKNIILKVSSMIVSVLTLVVIVLLFWFIITQPEDNWNKPLVDILGYIVIFFNTLMYLGPGQKIVKVIQTGDTCLIPIISCIVGIFSCCAWTLFSLIDIEAQRSVIDLATFVPNALGIIFISIQIIVWLYFKRKEMNNVTSNEEEHKLQLTKGENESL